MANTCPRFGRCPSECITADFIICFLQIKPKNLDGLEIDAPLPSRSGQVGSLSRKGTVYDIWSMGDEDTEFAGAEELRGLSCLLPRRKKAGKLYMAPKEIARHLVVSAQPSRGHPSGGPTHSVPKSFSPLTSKRITQASFRAIWRSSEAFNNT